MTVTFRCGHRREIADSFTGTPRCGECAETGVARVNVRPPSFVGLVRGPFATFRDLEPVIVNLRSERRDDA